MILEPLPDVRQDVRISILTNLIGILSEQMTT
jgi:hypothetical protein